MRIKLISLVEKNWRCFVKYCLVGISGTVIDVGGFALLLSFTPLNIYVAAAFSFIAAITNNFAWNKIWTFQDRQKQIKKQYIKYLLVSIGGLGLNIFFLWLFIMIIAAILGSADQQLPLLAIVIAKLAAIAVVGIYNFSMNKLWTFRQVCEV